MYSFRPANRRTWVVIAFHPVRIVTGTALAVAGVAAVVLCRLGFLSEGYARATLGGHNRLRGLLRMRPADPLRWARGLKSAFAFGMAMGVITASIGVATLVKGFG